MTKSERDQLLADLKQMSYDEALAYMNLLAGPPLVLLGFIPVFMLDGVRIQIAEQQGKTRVWVY
jgi:hypothetical protein